MGDSWPFDQQENVAAVTTRKVIEGSPVLYVVHYEDDHSWAFTCGTTDEVADGRVISMDEALQIDPSLAQIANLPPGRSARRERVGSNWRRFRSEFD
jgi:hypothetical protein